MAQLQIDANSSKDPHKIVSAYSPRSQNNLQKRKFKGKGGEGVGSRTNSIININNRAPNSIIASQEKFLSLFKDTYYLYKIFVLGPSSSFLSSNFLSGLKESLGFESVLRKLIIQDLKDLSVRRETFPYIKAILYFSLIKETLKELPTFRILDTLAESLDILPVEKYKGFYLSLFEDINVMNIRFSSPADKAFPNSYREMIEQYEELINLVQNKLAN